AGGEPRRPRENREAQDKAPASRAKFEREATELMQRCAQQRGVLGHLSEARGIKPATRKKTPRQTVGDEIAVLSEWCEIIATELERLRTAEEQERKGETAAMDRVW